MISSFLNIGKTLWQTFERKKLHKVIFFVTSTCNLRCSHCFYWQNLNRQEDLQMEDIKKVSLNLPSFDTLLLSGGEPFLRKELPEIIRLFYENNNINTVNIPTNGTLMSLIAPKVEEILNISKELKVCVFFSLDGLAEFHDTLRGMKGSFEKNLASMRKLSELKKQYSNLFIHVSSVICGHNIDEIRKLIFFIRSFGAEFLETHCFSMVNGNPRDSSSKRYDIEQLSDLLENTIIPYEEEQRRILKKADYGFFARVVARIDMSMVAFGYRMQLEYLSKGKKWGIECMAGKTIFVIDSNGDLRSCEARPLLVNVKEIDYDFKSFIGSEKFFAELEDIRMSRCSCTHGCFLYESIFKNPKLIFLMWPLLAMKSLIKFR